MKDSFHRRESDSTQGRFETLTVEWEEGVERPQEMRIYRETAKTILSRNESPDLPFRWSVNPYRGCAHACAYCYARHYHEYLGWGAGTDFDTRIVAKTNCPELLDKEISKPSWKQEPLAFSGVTDCYQPAERALGLTRQCLEVCLRRKTPIGIITKSSLILRDLDVLGALARGPGATAVMSIPFDEAEDAKGMEPYASTPDSRFSTLEKLSAAGIRTGISISPVIPGWNDSAIPRILERAKACGAKFAFYVLLRLPGAVEDVFMFRMREKFPDRVGKVEHHIRETHGGALKLTEFGTRMRGQGKMADMIEDLFQLHAKKNGLEMGEHMAGLVPESKAEKKAKTPEPKPKSNVVQLGLFD